MPYKFIDLFAGIGGFHYAFHDVGAQCVFASEIDRYARNTYQNNFQDISPRLFFLGNFNEDIMSHNPFKIPNFDILCAGFPCQPFSQAGLKNGFAETKNSQGRMFHKICNIIMYHRPKAIFLENVRHILKHNYGKTFQHIKFMLDSLDYDLSYKVVKASDFGLPQHRPRLFIIGFRKEDKYPTPFEHPTPIPLTMTMSDVFQGECNKKIGYTLRVGGRGSGLHDRRNWDTYLVDGKEVRLTSKEGLIMQGFPEDFEFPVSETQAMKQLGNSVAINAVRAYASAIVKRLDEEITSPSSSRT